MSLYQPISILEYQGTMNSRGDSQGHYICDVKDVNSNKWFRTNDNREPLPIQESDVSKLGYIILFKRNHQ